MVVEVVVVVEDDQLADWLTDRTIGRLNITQQL